MRRVYLILVLLPFLFYSCEEMVTNVDVPQSEPHYVLHAYLSCEDSVVTVTAGKSKPVFGEQTTDTSWVAQAHVYINDFELTRVPNTYYQFSCPVNAFEVVAGETYTVALRIGSETVCSGKCTVPLSMNETLTFDGLDSVQYDEYEGQAYYDYYALFSFVDPAGDENYYRIGAEMSYYDEFSGDTTVIQMYPSSENFLKDILFDGEDYSGRLLINYFESISSLVGLKLILYTTDNNYYYYHRAILSQSGDDPFSEPVTVPSNVDNGLGCVAAYRKFALKVF
ncbi:hypothetical protein SDC9_69926 [bioreactor metagenome]|uniref:DUF4249 domain-containing protein n=1 Tax=bioreactor metagenome TaxID=1076179 RepID=A0A644YA51_9ZZZZ